MQASIIHLLGWCCLKRRTGADKVARAAPRVDAVCRPWQNYWDPEGGRSSFPFLKSARRFNVLFLDPWKRWRELACAERLFFRCHVTGTDFLPCWKRLVNNHAPFNIHRMEWERGHWDPRCRQTECISKRHQQSWGVWWLVSPPTSPPSWKTNCVACNCPSIWHI